MPRVLHLLPHRGGGAETYVDLLESMAGYTHRRCALSATRQPRLAPLSIAARSPRVIRAIRSSDLVQVHGDMAALLAQPLLSLRPSILTTQGLHLLRRAEGFRRSAIERGFEASVRRSACVLCSSHEEFRELAEALSPSARRKLLVVPSGVPLPSLEAGQRQAARAELGLAEETCVALFLGQLEERKDPLTAARAVLEVRRRGLDVALLVAGDGPLRGQLEALAGPGLQVLGFCEDAERLLAASDLFLLPSSREGLSFALLEAMSHGLVPVVADGPGNAEGVGEAGVVLPFGDVGAFAGALERLASGGAERRRLGEAARERVASEYGVDKLVRGVERAYRIALSSRRR